jgi:DNA processing protein
LREFKAPPTIKVGRSGRQLQYKGGPTFFVVVTVPAGGHLQVQEAVTLSLLEGLSRRRLGEQFRRRLATPSTSVAQTLTESPAPTSGSSIHDILRVASRQPITRDRLETARQRADEALKRAERSRIVPLVLGSAPYPLALESIVDPPVVLWCRGSLERFEQPAVAIVGARAATAYGRAVAAKLGTDLASHSVTVVSGLARGVDVAAHEGALRSSRQWCTVAVLGCGVDVMYPAEHETIAQAIAARGAIVSEFPPGTPPLPQHFPRRNRIISGLSQAVVVVEAAERSGALITADYALEQGRDVLAVPGSVLTGRNRGAHALLRDGAKIVEDADDILEELGCPAGLQGRERSSPARGVRDPILHCMDPGETYELDDLVRESGLTATALLPRLLELELAGLVQREGAQFVRVGRVVLT